MVSLKIYKSGPFSRDTFLKEFKVFNEELERSTQLKEEFVFRASIEQMKPINDDFVTFKFQHDLKHEIDIRGRLIEYPKFHYGEFWIFFTKKSNFIFVNGDENSVDFLVGRLFQKIKNSFFKDVVHDRLSLENDTFLELLHTDALEINASWWKKVDEDLRSVFLSGNLKDKDGEHEIFQMIKDKAGDISSATYRSNKLGYKISMSRKKFSMNSSKKEVEAGTLLKYFKEMIYPLLQTS